jgi:hypothetical protein
MDFTENVRGSMIENIFYILGILFHYGLIIFFAFIFILAIIHAIIEKRGKNNND